MSSQQDRRRWRWKLVRGWWRFVLWQWIGKLGSGGDKTIGGEGGRVAHDDGLQLHGLGPRLEPVVAVADAAATAAAADDQHDDNHANPVETTGEGEDKVKDAVGWGGGGGLDGGLVGLGVGCLGQQQQRDAPGEYQRSC